jgi:hypothetical protein
MTFDEKKQQPDKSLNYVRPTAILDSVDRNIDKKVKMAVKRMYSNCNLSFKTTKVYDLTKSQTVKRGESC